MDFCEELRADNDELRRQNAELEAKDQSSDEGWEDERPDVKQSKLDCS